MTLTALRVCDDYLKEKDARSNDGRSQSLNRCPSPPLMDSPPPLSRLRQRLHETSERDSNRPILTCCSVTNTVLLRVLLISACITKKRSNTRRGIHCLVSCPYLPGEIISRACGVVFNRASEVTRYSELMRNGHTTICQQ